MIRFPTPGLVKLMVAWIAGVATVGLIGLGIVLSGAFDATATKPHEPLVAWATHSAFKHSVRLRASVVEPPGSLSRSQVLAGLEDYDRNCRTCHGGPGLSRATFAAAMAPTPPYLIDASRHWTPRQLYWIIHDGVKMTGMPAWGESQTDDQVWGLVAFLQVLPRISAANYRQLLAVQQGRASYNDEAALLALDRMTPLTLESRDREFPPWLTLAAELSIVCAIVCALIIAQDLIRRPQKMWIMNLVWPLAALFGSVLWLVGYYLWGREPAQGRGEKRRAPYAARVAVGASHCGAGCALGDIISEWLVFAVPSVALAFGWTTIFAEKTFAVWILDYAVAFLIGILFQYFTIKPMRDLSVGQGVWQAIKADFASITAWQVGMYGVMGLLQFQVLQRGFGHIAPVNSPVFWFAMQGAMLAGFCTSYPVNWWLIRLGVKEDM